jgi:3-hydroxybutyrate dehydrogenase
MTMMTSTTEAPLSTKGLVGKSAIVTGSTSGIGLGIARAFAAAGMTVTLNGFGDKAEIERTRANLSAAFHAIRAAVPGMKSRKWGRIINVASAHALVASPYKSAYVAAKHGILGLTKTVALETAEFGITCNAICPGYVLTPLVQKQIPETAKARNLTEEQVIRDVLLHAQPTRKFVTTEEIGGLAVFLCTGAGASITGAPLPIEGGWTAQ